VENIDSLLLERNGSVWVLTINRPAVRNAVDGSTARALEAAFLAFDADPEARGGGNRRDRGIEKRCGAHEQAHEIF